MYKSFILIALTSGAVNAEKLSFQQDLNLSTERISALDVINGAGDIKLSAYNGPDIRVSATIESSEYHSMERFKEIFERDMVLRIDRESEYAVLRGHSKSGLRKSPNIAIHLDIQVPASLDVDVDDGSGSIHVSGLTGFLKIDDGSGDIHINNIANSINIDDGSGHISIDQVQGAIGIDDGSGSIEVSNSEGDVNIDDGSGDITLTEVNGDKDIEDGSGDITVNSGEGDVDVDDGSGDIKLRDIAGSAVINDGSGSIYIDALGGSLNIKNAGSGKVIIDGENRTKEF